MLFVRRGIDWPPWGWSNPFEELDRMRSQIEWLRSGLSRAPYGESAAGVFPLLNVTEDADKYYIRAELPGLEAEDLGISVTGETLSITGERKLPAEDDKAQYHRREREAGNFSRIVSLPAQIDSDKVEARCVDGVLTVTLPKAAAAKPRQIAVKAS